MVFADHGALLDPPTEDVSARCAMLLARLGDSEAFRSVKRKCLEYLLRSQEPDGSWYGRWGTNYIYGTWSVLMALEEEGLGIEHEAVRRGAAWLNSVQRADGGWSTANETLRRASVRRAFWMSGVANANAQSPSPRCCSRCVTRSPV